MLPPNSKLPAFLAAYDDSIQQLFLDLRTFVLENIPPVNELIYDSYNALTVAYTRSEKLSDAFCHLAVYSRHVNVGFNRGTELHPRGITLRGEGRLIRHLPVRDRTALPETAAKKLLAEAYENALRHNETLRDTEVAPRSIIMSVSTRKRRPES